VIVNCVLYVCIVHDDEPLPSSMLDVKLNTISVQTIAQNLPETFSIQK